jgi:restriction endonuclease S subunit
VSWTTSTIGDVLNVIQNGINCKQAKDGVGDKISRIETISDASVNFNKVGYAVLTESEKHKAKLHKNDILFSHINSPIHVGKSALYADEETLYHGINLLRLRVNGNVDSRFFNYFLNRLFWSGYWKRTAKQSVNQASVNQTDIKVVPFSFPPIPEQQRIVTILDQAFADIEKARANAEKNLKNARELFESTCSTAIFAKKYSSNLTVVDVVRDEKGAMRTGPFGSQLLKREIVDEGIAVLGIDNAVKNSFQWGVKRFITPEKFKELSRFEVKPGDVLITIMGTCGRCAIVPDNIPKAINTKHICCITLDDAKCLPEYLHAYFLYHPLAREYLLKKAKGAIMAGLNMGIIKELPLDLPSVELQREIVSQVVVLRENTDRLLLSYNKKLTSLDELKKSLLQKAFSGELTKTEGMVA